MPWPVPPRLGHNPNSASATSRDTARVLSWLAEDSIGDLTPVLGVFCVFWFFVFFFSPLGT